MEHFHEEFLTKDVVNGEMIADKLVDKKVIPKVASAIFNHVKKQGDYKSLETLCTVMKNEGGMNQMNKLGEKMLECLVASEFIMFVLYIHNIMYAYMVYMHDIVHTHACTLRTHGLHAFSGAHS